MLMLIIGSEVDSGVQCSQCTLGGVGAILNRGYFEQNGITVVMSTIQYNRRTIHSVTIFSNFIIGAM